MRGERAGKLRERAAARKRVKVTARPRGVPPSSPPAPDGDPLKVHPPYGTARSTNGRTCRRCSHKTLFASRKLSIHITTS